MKLRFTRKTWYFLLLTAAAVSMADGFGRLAGLSLSFFETVAFGFCGLAALFLAAQKEPGSDEGVTLSGKRSRGRPMPQAGAFFVCFLILLTGYLLADSTLAMRTPIFWPLLVYIELRRGMPVRAQLRLLLFSEILQFGALLAANAAVPGFGMLNTVFWILTCAARGWAALVLYRAPEPGAPRG
jgi:hypothetical protein